MSTGIPNISYTTEHHLCSGCGVCQGACPFGAISVEVVNGEYRPVVDAIKCHNEKGCHRCYDSCPGLGITDMRIQDYEEQLIHDPYIGDYLLCYSAKANDADLRFHAASGGTLSAFLIWLLQNNHIDGAVVTRFSAQAPMLNQVFIATSADEIREAKSSKYAPVSFEHVAQRLKQAIGSRYVVVGLPCHIQGMRKLLKIDKPLREKIVGLFSLYCSGTRTFNFTEYLFQTRHIDKSKLTYLAYRDNGCLGGMVAKGEGIDYYEPYQSYSHPLRSMFYPHRCLLCIDHFGEYSDISFGDLHIPPYSQDKTGVNSLVVRSSRWQELLQSAVQDGALSIENLLPDVLLKAQKMAYIKKTRNLAYCAILAKLNQPIPQYDASLPKVGLKQLIDFIQIQCQRMVGKHRSIWPLIPLLKAKVHID